MILMILLWPMSNIFQSCNICKMFSTWLIYYLIWLWWYIPLSLHPILPPHQTGPKHIYLRINDRTTSNLLLWRDWNGEKIYRRDLCRANIIDIHKWVIQYLSTRPWVQVYDAICDVAWNKLPTKSCWGQPSWMCIAKRGMMNSKVIHLP